jgi:BirA family biotin operon repressor/biotin-[acetyl-CoA-carboxylase] ligase
MPEKLNVNKLQETLQTKRFGRNLVLLHEIDSTNTYAKKLAKYGATQGTAVIAETQRAGRGRLNRKWISPKGGLYFSIVLRPELKANETAKLAFVAGLTVAEVLQELYGLQVATKWPNDVLVGKQKICGILSEMNSTDDKTTFVVMGIGVNANFCVKKTLPEELWEKTTSLEDQLGRKIQLEQLFATLLEKFECVYERFLRGGFIPILGEWMKFSDFVGQKITVTFVGEELAGLATGVDDDGALLVKFENGTLKRVVAGDVSVHYA